MNKIYFYLTVITLIGIFIVWLKFKLKQIKDLKKENEEIKKDLASLKEINEKIKEVKADEKEAKEKITTGDNSVDFANSIDILHDIATRG